MSIQYFFELGGSALFAISGALLANDKSQADWFGVTFIGFITSLGGGTVRDVLLGAYPLRWVADIHICAAIMGGIILSSVFYPFFIRWRKYLFLFETLGIAMFTILGTHKALEQGVHPLIASVLGMFSAVMGGVLRDVLTNDTPVLFRKEVYATACMAGALLYVALLETGISDTYSQVYGMFTVATIRFVSVRYNLSLPKFRRSSQNG